MVGCRQGNGMWITLDSVIEGVGVRGEWGDLWASDAVFSQGGGGLSLKLLFWSCCSGFGFLDLSCWVWMVVLHVHDEGGYRFWLLFWISCYFRE